jgi:hypothetical protein
MKGEFTLIEFTLDQVTEMLKAAMDTPGGRGRLRLPGREHLEQLREMTNGLIAAHLVKKTTTNEHGLVAGQVTVRELRELLPASKKVEEAVSALRRYHELLAELGVDVSEVDAMLDSYVDRLRQLDPILADPKGAAREAAEAELKKLPSEIALLAESLSFACQMAFIPRYGPDAPSLTSNNAVTKYPGIVIGKLPGKKELAGGAVKQDILRLNKWREKWWGEGTRGRRAKVGTSS